MVSVGYFATLTGSFGAVKSSGDALEAQRVAEIESNKIKLTDYENLDSKVQQGKWVDAPDNPGWQYFVTLGSEKVIDGDNKQRIAEVKVRRKGDEESRFSTVVPVASNEGGGSGKGFKVAEIKMYEGEMIGGQFADVRKIVKIIDGPYHHINAYTGRYALWEPGKDSVTIKKSGILVIPLHARTYHTSGHDGGGSSHACIQGMIINGKEYRVNTSSWAQPPTPNIFPIEKNTVIKFKHYPFCNDINSFYGQPYWTLYYID